MLGCARYLPGQIDRQTDRQTDRIICYLGSALDIFGGFVREPCFF